MEYEKRDHRLKIINHKENTGRPAFAKNTALANANEKYVCFLDHDDLFHPEKLSQLTGVLEKYPQCVAAFHDINIIDSSGKPKYRYLDDFPKTAKEYLTKIEDNIYLTKPNFYKFQSITYAAIHTISVMICADRLPDQEIRYDTQYKVCDDTDLWVRLGLCGQIAYIDSVLANYRLHESNITRDKLKFSNDTILFLKNNYARLSDKLTNNEKKQMRQRIANSLSRHGWICRCNGNHTEAFKAYLDANKWHFKVSNVINLLKSPLKPISKDI